MIHDTKKSDLKLSEILKPIYQHNDIKKLEVEISETLRRT